jgi:cell division protein FtsB
VRVAQELLQLQVEVEVILFSLPSLLPAAAAVAVQQLTRTLVQQEAQVAALAAEVTVLAPVELLTKVIKAVIILVIAAALQEAAVPEQWELIIPRVVLVQHLVVQV